MTRNSRQLSNAVDTTTQSSSDIQSAYVKRKIRQGEDFSYSIGCVIEVINDPYYFQKEVAPTYIEKEILKNKEIPYELPRNSLLVMIEGENNGNLLTPVIPFYGSHIGTPIKVGEHVWISEDGSQFKYWHGRCGTVATAEDLNFSDNDRKFLEPSVESEEAKDKKDTKQKKILPKFRQKIQDAIQELGDLKAKDKKDKENPKGLRDEKLRELYVQEPVPRWSPRQGDAFIQGSNNTLISLGTDRGYSIESTLPKYSSANDKPKPKSGSIDIVVGRGNYQYTPTKENSKGAFDGTAPAVITTEENLLEVDKAPNVNKLESNPIEGDPHFETDMARIYLSMDTEVDKNFWPKTKYSPLYLDISEDNAGPAIALQSKHFRVYSKEDGEIRIVKQGNETTQSHIILHTDGKITISGEHIILGRKLENGETDSEYKSEPYVRYSELHRYMEEFHTILEDLCTGIESNKSPGNFAPDIIIQAAATKFKSSQTALRETFKEIKSTRIFGE